MALGMSPGQAQAMGQGYQGGDTMGSPSGEAPGGNEPAINSPLMMSINNQLAGQQNNKNLGIVGVLFGGNKARTNYFDNVMPPDVYNTYGITPPDQSISIMPENQNLNMQEKSPFSGITSNFNIPLGGGDLNLLNPLKGSVGFQYKYEK